MSDFDRFTAFLGREAAGYNAPPETPAEGMWAGFEEALASTEAAYPATIGAVGEAGAPAGVGIVDDASFLAPGYNQPPPAPRDDMWERIEAEWASRPRVVPAAGRYGQQGEGRTRPLRTWVGRPGGAGWAAMLAAAASLVLALSLRQDTGNSSSTEASVQPDVPTAVSQTATVADDLASDPPPAQTASPTTPTPEVVAAQQTAADEPSGEVLTTSVGEPANRVAESTAAEQPVFLSERFELEGDYATVRHLGRAETLLTAFRIDHGTPGSEQDLAVWARELLGDTRMFLDMSGSRSPLERALLEDLELVLIQIARLGPEAPDFERLLARESMDQQATLMRLRAATTTGET